MTKNNIKNMSDIILRNVKMTTFLSKSGNIYDLNLKGTMKI